MLVSDSSSTQFQGTFNSVGSAAGQQSNDRLDGTSESGRGKRPGEGTNVSAVLQESLKAILKFSVFSKEIAMPLNQRSRHYRPPPPQSSFSDPRDLQDDGHFQARPSEDGTGVWMYLDVLDSFLAVTFLYLHRIHTFQTVRMALYDEKEKWFEVCASAMTPSLLF